jgi:segregation and condensation protein B
MDQTLIQRIIEAALLAAHQPLNLVQLSALFPEDAPAPSGAIEQALRQLREDCAERGVELVEVASGFRYQVRADLQPWVARLWTERQTKYSRATLETLALIAYRQPITRGEIEQVRGVAVNSNLIKALEEREWIRVVGHRDVPGKPELLGTTRAFLDYFGLKSLDQLPPLSELREVPEFDPQLPFGGAPTPAMLGDNEGSELDTDDLDAHAFDANAAEDDDADSEYDNVRTIRADHHDQSVSMTDPIEEASVQPAESNSTRSNSTRSADADAHEQTP